MALATSGIAAFQSVLEECAASRDTLVASSYIPAQGFQPFLRDFALRKDTPDALTAALNANPEVKALISKISYKPVVFSDANITTDEGLRFMTTAGDTLEAGQLRTLAAEKGMSWTVTDQGEVIPETVTTESLVGVLDTVCGAFEVMLKPSSLAASSLALQNDDARVLYQKEIEIGDVDGDDNADSFAFRDPTEQAFCERVAGWENVTLQDCFLLRTQSGNAQVLTPEHPYTIQYFRTGPYRITFSGDNVPKEEEVLEKWAEMLRDTSYRDQELHCTFKPAEYGYDVMANMGILLEECLKSFPQTESIDAQYAYRTDDHANHYDGGYAYDYSYCFQCDRTPVPEDFPSLDVASIQKDELTGAWKMYLNNDRYSDYFAGFRTMLDSEIVKNLSFDYIITQLFDDRDDAQMNLPERTVVYRRGDIDGNAESLAEIIRAGLPDEVIPAETPTEDCISYHCEYQYEGVAVTCEDIEALKKDGLNGIPVEWSDGIWSTYWNPAGAEFLLQPIEGLSKEFGDFLKYEGGIPDGAEDMAFTLPEEYTDLDEPVYVLYTPKADAGRLETALAADSSVTVIGALFCGMLDPMEYIGPLFKIVAEDGVNLTPEFFGEYAPYASFDPVENAWNIPLAVDANTTLEEALVIQKQIAAMDGIRSVGMLGMCLESLENPVATTVKNIPFTPKTLTGDVDGDGKVTAFDASLALTGFNEATVMDYEPEERTLSTAQEKIADVDGDGLLTAFDATCILTYTNLKYNAGFDDLTWEDVLPKK